MSRAAVEERLNEMIDRAWAVRAHARVMGKTRVGCAVLSAEGNITTGCNIEHRYRSHDIHAEVNALSSVVARGDSLAIGVLVVAKRTKFTPCGSCMDWIFEVGGPECWVGFQPSREMGVIWYRAVELMPHYPA